MLDKDLDKEIRDLLIAIDVAIARMNNEKEETEKREKKQALINLVRIFPEKIGGKITDTTIGKFLEVSHRVSLYLYQQASITHLDLVLYDLACESKNKRAIMKKFFDLKEKQMIFEDKLTKIVDISLINVNELNFKKIFLINKLSSSKGILSREEREDLINLSSIRGVEKDFQKLFTVKVKKSKELGYKDDLVELNFTALNYQMLVLNNNDTKSVSINKNLLENIVLGYHSISRDNIDIQGCVKDFKLEIITGRNPIKFTLTVEEKQNKDVCELFVNKMRDFLENVAVDGRLNDVFHFMYIKGQELAIGVREIKLREKLSKQSIENSGKESVSMDKEEKKRKKI